LGEAFASGDELVETLSFERIYKMGKKKSKAMDA
jgi:hypothetical protein